MVLHCCVFHFHSRLLQRSSRGPRVYSWEIAGLPSPCFRGFHLSSACLTRSALYLPLRTHRKHHAAPVCYPPTSKKSQTLHVIVLFSLKVMPYTRRNRRAPLCKHILVWSPNQVTHTPRIHWCMWPEKLLFPLSCHRLFITSHWQWCQNHWHSRDSSTYATKETPAWDWQLQIFYRGMSAQRKSHTPPYKYIFNVM